MRDGIARFEIKLNTQLFYTANLEAYDPNTKEGCTAELTDVPVLVEIPLRRSVTINMTGVVYDQRSGLPLTNALVTLTNDCDPRSWRRCGPMKMVHHFLLNRDCCYKVKAEDAGLPG